MISCRQNKGFGTVEMDEACPDCRKCFRRPCELALHRKSFPNGSCAQMHGARPTPRQAGTSSPRESQHAMQQPAQPPSRATDEPEEMQTTPQFDTRYEFAKLVGSLNNGEGIVQADLKLLLELLRNPEFETAQLFSSTTEYTTYKEQLLREHDDGWHEVSIDLTGVWPYNPTFRYRSPMHWLRGVLADQQFAKVFVYDAKPEYGSSSSSSSGGGGSSTSAQGPREYSQPWDSDAWVDEQLRVRNAHGPGAVVAAVQLYSDKTNCNNTTSAYPIKAALLNLPQKIKVKHIATLAYIPLLREDPAMTDNQHRTAKRQLLCACLETVLAALKSASQTGFHCAGPDGQSRLWLPRVLSYVADDPEQRAVLQLYASNSCKRPCCRCYATTDCLSDHSTHFMLRTADRQQSIRDQMRAADAAAAAAAAAAEESGSSSDDDEPQQEQQQQQQQQHMSAAAVSKQYSTHPETSGVCGFAGGPICDVYQIFGYEHLHVWDLGWLPLVVSVIKLRADAVGRPVSPRGLVRGAGSRALRTLDRRMREMPRAECFYLPTWSKYFSKPSYIQAKHHRAVLRVLPHLLHGLVDDGLTEMACIANQLGQLLYTRRQRDVFSDSSLNTIGETVQALLAKIKALAPSVNLNTPKVHKLTHFAADVRRIGHPRHTNSDFFEYDHIHIKRAYRGTSRKATNKQYIQEIVNNRRLQDALHAKEQQRLRELHTAGSSSTGSTAAVAVAVPAGPAGSSTGAGSSSRMLPAPAAAGSSSSSSSSSSSRQQAARYAAAYMQAASGQHALSTTYETVSLSCIAFPDTAPTFTHAGYAQRSVAIRGWDEAMPRLPHRLREFLLSEELLHDRRRYSRTVLPPLPMSADRIRVHYSGVLAAVMPWDPEHLVLQTVRAKANFYGKPFFDVVAVKLATTATATTVAYAQLLLLFDMWMSTGNAPDSPMAWRPLAYVKWMKTIHQRGRGAVVDPLTRQGAALMEWEMQDDPAAAGSRQCRCGIIHLSSILRREYVVQDFTHDGRFHMSPFKYDGT